ncbi:MAG: carboxylating nicotinate-nucleotide diphosphorylase [Acidimicrobiales bacterium]
MSAPVQPPEAAVRRAVSLALEEDLLPLGDITAALLPAGAPGRAAFVVRAEGVIAGTACLLETCRQVDPALSVNLLLGDGSLVTSGQAIATVEGAMASIVTAERTALNFVSHLSGVASLTARYVAAATARNPATRVLDTRKTTPGLRALEKAAVRAGGGWNHRGNLSEGVLVKDNHLGSATIGEAVRRARHLWPGRMVEVECDRIEQVSEAVAAGATIVLCDNMSPEELGRCVELARAHAGPSGNRVLIEASGGVTLETIGAFAAAGADLVSVGALTHSAPILDVGLDLAAEAPAGLG